VRKKLPLGHFEDLPTNHRVLPVLKDTSPFPGKNPSWPLEVLLWTTNAFGEKKKKRRKKTTRQSVGEEIKKNLRSIIPENHSRKTGSKTHMEMI